MSKIIKLWTLSIVVILVFVIAGCSSTKMNTDPKPAVQPTESPESFVEKNLKETSLQQWDQLYTTLHPDVQAKYAVEQYIAVGKESGAQFVSSVKDYKVGTAVMLSTWKDTKGMGNEYKDVAEVPITYNFKDGTSVNGPMHVVKVDGTWRWFWGPPVASQIIPSKKVDFGQESELGQFGFKVLNSENTKEAKTPTKSISVTTNTYEIVRLEITNKRSAPAQLKDFTIKLMDMDKKITYDLNADATISMSSSLKIYDKKPAVYLYDDMNPNLKNEFTGVFEVPSDANYALVITYKNDGMILKLK